MYITYIIVELVPVTKSELEGGLPPPFRSSKAAAAAAAAASPSTIMDATNWSDDTSAAEAKRTRKERAPDFDLAKVV